MIEDWELILNVILLFNIKNYLLLKYKFSINNKEIYTIHSNEYLNINITSQLIQSVIIWMKDFSNISFQKIYIN